MLSVVRRSHRPSQSRRQWAWRAARRYWRRRSSRTRSWSSPGTRSSCRSTREVCARFPQFSVLSPQAPLPPCRYERSHIPTPTPTLTPFPHPFCPLECSVHNQSPTHPHTSVTCNHLLVVTWHGPRGHVGRVNVLKEQPKEVGGATRTVLTLDDVQPSDAGLYRLVAKNATGETVGTVTLSADGTPNTCEYATNYSEMARGQNLRTALTA